MTPEERFKGLEILQPEIEAVLQETADAIRKLEPTEELRADHDRLIQYLEETADVARAITAAAKERSFEETQVEVDRSGTVFCAARGDLTDTVKPLVDFFFRATPAACGGQSF